MSEAIATTPLRAVFQFPFQGPKWQERFLIGSALVLAGTAIPIVPTLFAFGYALQVMRQAIKGESLSLPAWDDWAKFGLDGLRGTVVSLAYLLPGLLIFIGGMTIYFVSALILPIAAGMAGEEGNAALALPMMALFFASLGIMMLSTFLGFILLFAGVLPIPMAMAHMVACDKLGAAFRVREWWKLLRANWLGYGISLVVAAGLTMVVYIAVTLFYYSIVLCCLIPLAAAPTGFYLSLVSAAIFGQTYRESISLLEARNKMVTA